MRENTFINQTHPIGVCKMGPRADRGSCDPSYIHSGNPKSRRK